MKWNLPAAFGQGAGELVFNKACCLPKHWALFSRLHPGKCFAEHAWCFYSSALQIYIVTLAGGPLQWGSLWSLSKSTRGTGSQVLCSLVVVFHSLRFQMSNFTPFILFYFLMKKMKLPLPQHFLQCNIDMCGVSSMWCVAKENWTGLVCKSTAGLK